MSEGCVCPDGAVVTEIGGGYSGAQTFKIVKNGRAFFQKVVTIGKGSVDGRAGNAHECVERLYEIDKLYRDLGVPAVRLTTAGAIDMGRYFATFDWVDGRNGNELVASKPIEFFYQIGKTVGGYLATLGKAGFVHGDVKLGNIMVDDAGGVVLCDIETTRRGKLIENLKWAIGVFSPTEGAQYRALQRGIFETMGGYDEGAMLGLYKRCFDKKLRIEREKYLPWLERAKAETGDFTHDIVRKV